MICWRRLRDWQGAGIWEKLHRVLFDRLAQADATDWSRATLGGAAVPAKRGQFPESFDNQGGEAGRTQAA